MLPADIAAKQEQQAKYAPEIPEEGYEHSGDEEVREVLQLVLPAKLTDSLEPRWSVARTISAGSC